MKRERWSGRGLTLAASTASTPEGFFSSKDCRSAPRRRFAFAPFSSKGDVTGFGGFFSEDFLSTRIGLDTDVARGEMTIVDCSRASATIGAASALGDDSGVEARFDTGVDATFAEADPSPGSARAGVGLFGDRAGDLGFSGAFVSSSVRTRRDSSRISRTYSRLPEQLPLMPLVRLTFPMDTRETGSRSVLKLCR
jgi:hypothetical protein